MTILERRTEDSTSAERDTVQEEPTNSSTAAAFFQVVTAVSPQVPAGHQHSLIDPALPDCRCHAMCVIAAIRYNLGAVMINSNSHASANSSQRQSMLLGIWATVLVLCVASLIYIYQRPTSLPPQLPTPPAAERVVQRAQFFDDAVQPAIAEADLANREAAKRCIQRLQDTFNGYRKGITPFSEDLTSWGTRWGVVSRMPSDWWYEKTDVQKFVTKKFEARLFSQQSLQRGIEDELAKFRKEIEANNRNLLTNVRAAVSKSDLPQLSPIDYDTYSAEVTEFLQAYSASAATRSVQNLILTEIASGTAGAAAAQIVVAVGTRLAAMAATTAATAGGATAVGGAAGGTGGTLAGPVGTAVGAGVGIAAGVIIDWWMSSHFKATLSAELNEMIDTLSSTVINGTQEQMGIEQSLSEACDALRDAYRQSFYDRIVQESRE